ncbi:hypothetical protein [Litorisediminicola beolgyonensis]|uniref:Excalibur calcium-binding domain-containing protein n=1 Tax=Litorisediminicola beolgyonensis TaxID=1173614 RepID=A0ABW3ZGU4_9RHOB
MRSLLLVSAALTGLAACQPTVPDSAAGVGFDNYDRARREALLNGSPTPQTATITPPPDVSGAPINASGDPVTEMAAAALARGDGTTVDPLAPAPQSVSNAAGISEENNFDAVSGERSIAEDAALIAQNSAQYQQVQPTALPTRTGAEGPNIVAYALSTTNAVGQSIYSRSAFASKDKEARNCAAYSSADLAQLDFLSSGGPDRDRKGLDADGDGFACSWSPAPFRAAARN